LWRWTKPLLKAVSHRIQDSSEQGILLKSGLICLKGGDLSQEISESGLRPKSIEINKLFEEDFFKEKYLLYTIL
jgi:16S rRNA (guanine527-N7)-methyltransferase